MDSLAVGFWGAFLGTAGLMLTASLTAFAVSRQKVALTAALSSIISALFAVAYLGWLPVEDAGLQARLLAHVAAVCATALGLMLLAMLGLLRDRRRARMIVAGMVSLAVAVLAAGWVLDAMPSLAVASVMAFVVGAVALMICVRSALRGDRLAWVAVSGVSFMLVAVSGLSWIALNRETAGWPVHAVSAVAGIAYLATMASALWSRYSYLLELREVMAHGPSYDPVTRMRSHAETGQMLGAAFFRHEGEKHPVGVIVVSLGNLYALEKLHGRWAVNHALFLCASRLRRSMPTNVEMGRLADDGFLLLMRNSADPKVLGALARQVAARLSRPVMLGTSPDPEHLQAANTQWTADVGVGVLQALPEVRPAAAVGMARAMSRTAWSYASRVAWFDPVAEQISELVMPEAG